MASSSRSVPPVNPSVNNPHLPVNNPPMINPMMNSLNQENPFYMHPGENPAIILVQPVLTGSENFINWRRSMKMALSSKNKFGFVDGSIPCPAENDRNYMFWIQCNDLVASWLAHSVSPDIAESILWFNSAHEAWTDLAERFGSAGDVYRLSDILEEIQAIKQGSSSVSEYFTKLKRLWDQLMVLRPIPPCTCVALGVYREYNEAEHVIRFLKGLNDTFSTMKSQVLMITPLPSIKAVFAMALKLERQTKYSGVHESSVFGVNLNSENDTVKEGESVVMYNQKQSYGRGFSRSAGPNILRGSGSNTFARGSGTGYGRGISSGRAYGRSGYGRGPNVNLHCTHCGSVGHTIDRCYKKHGYPPGYKSREHVANNVYHGNTYVSSSSCEENSQAAKSEG